MDHHPRSLACRRPRQPMSNTELQVAVLPLLDDVHNSLQQVSAGGASAKNLLQLAMSSIMNFDEGVMRFVSQWHESILQENFDILNAYYDASQKTQNVALALQRHVGISITELKRLKAVVRSYKKGSERGYELAMKELDQVAEENIDLPQSLVEKLEEAMEAYVNVISMCNNAMQDLTESRAMVGMWIGQAVSACCAILMNVAIYAVEPSKEIVWSMVGGLAVAVVGGALSVGLCDRIEKLEALAKAITDPQDQGLLNRVKMDTENIIQEIKPLKDRTREMLEKLRSDDMSTAAKGLPQIEDIVGDDFPASLDTQLQELQALFGACDELCAMVNKAYQLFKKKSGFITQRVLRGENLY